MSAQAMALSRSWRTLIKAKKLRARYHIILDVRGRTVKKTFPNQQEYEKWLAVYRDRENGDHDLRIVKTELIYQ